MASSPPSVPGMTVADTASAPPSVPGMTVADTASTMPPNVFTDPMFVSVFAICIAAVIGIVYYASLGNGSTPVSSFDTTAASGTSTGGVSAGTYLFLSIAIVCACLYAVYYVLETSYGYDITTKIFGGTMQTGPEIDLDFNQNIEPTPAPTPPASTDQVFNVPDNVFDYTDADAVCKAFGSELATYDQIENAYQNGAEWGNYGWSAGQMAFFPTQKETYDTLQKIPGHEHDRGRIGINGGYIANPDVRFGANCYGQRPAITTEDEERMMNTVPYPQTAEDVALDNKVAEWSGRLDEIIVSPFNEQKWSEY
jgi:hypothetical protein